MTVRSVSSPAKIVCYLFAKSPDFLEQVKIQDHPTGFTEYLLSFWNIGEIASPGIKEMAETGETVLLGDEVQAEINSGNANQHLDYQWWFCPAGTNDFRCGFTTVEIDVTRAFPLITLVSMVGPSPDWFVGISSISLLAADRSWRKQIDKHNEVPVFLDDI